MMERIVYADQEGRFVIKYDAVEESLIISSCVGKFKGWVEKPIHIRKLIKVMERIAEGEEYFLPGEIWMDEYVAIERVS